MWNKTSSVQRTFAKKLFVRSSSKAPVLAEQRLDHCSNSQRQIHVGAATTTVLRDRAASKVGRLSGSCAARDGALDERAALQPKFPFARLFVVLLLVFYGDIYLHVLFIRVV